MLFDLNGIKFMVKFSHSNPCTYAELWQYKDDLMGWDCLNIVGIAECSKKDNFSKIKGRKIALRKLFERMNIFASEGQPELKNNRGQREIIWTLYFKECRRE